MKIKLPILLLFICNMVFSQDYPLNTKHIKTINATVYKKKDTVDHRTSVTYYDEDWIVLTNTNTLSSALDKGSKTVTITDNDKEYIQAIINSKKDTLDYIVYHFDDDGNRTNYYQIRNGDTLSDQKRTFDKNGNNLKLLNKKDGKYFLRFEAKYNDENKVTLRNYYNPLKQLVKIEKFEYSHDGKTSLYYKTNRKGVLTLQSKTTEIEPNKKKTTYYVDSKGINYGITLVTKKKDYSIKEKDDNERLKSYEIFNKRHKLTTSVYVTYKTIH